MSLVFSSFKEKFSKLAQGLNETIETSQTWEKIRNYLNEIGVLITKELSAHQHFVAEVSKIIGAVAKCIVSDRTLLSGSAIDLISKLVEVLKQGFSTFVDTICPAISKTLGKTNALYRKRGVGLFFLIIKEVHSPGVVRHICEATAVSSCIARPFGIRLFEELIASYPESILSSKRKLIETTLVKGIEEPVAGVRKVSQSSFQAYVDKFPSRRASLFSCVSVDKLSFLKPINSAAVLQQSSLPTLRSHSPSSSTLGPKTPNSTGHHFQDVLSVKSRVYEGITFTKPVIAQKKKQLSFHALPDFSQVKPKVDTRRLNPILHSKASNVPYSRPQAPTHKVNGSGPAIHHSNNGSLPKAATLIPAPKAMVNPSPAASSQKSDLISSGFKRAPNSSASTKYHKSPSATLGPRSDPLQIRAKLLNICRNKPAIVDYFPNPIQPRSEPLAIERNTSTMANYRPYSTQTRAKFHNINGHESSDTNTEDINDNICVTCKRKLEPSDEDRVKRNKLSEAPYFN